MTGSWRLLDKKRPVGWTGIVPAGCKSRPLRTTPLYYAWFTTTHVRSNCYATLLVMPLSIMSKGSAYMVRHRQDRRQSEGDTSWTERQLTRLGINSDAYWLRLEDSSTGSSKGDSREGQLKTILIEGRAKKTPKGQVKKTPVEGQVRRLQTGSTEDDPNWMPSKEDSREGQMKTTPKEGRAKKTPKVQVKKTPVEGKVRRLQRGSTEDDPDRSSSKEDSKGSSEEDSNRGSSKEDRPVLPSGKTPHDINPVIV